MTDHVAALEAAQRILAAYKDFEWLRGELPHGERLEFRVPHDCLIVARAYVALHRDEEGR